MTATTTTVRAVASTEALRSPRAALRVIEQHLRSDTGGRCATCGQMSPCPQLDLAYTGLHGTSVLPRRTPMALLVKRPTFDAFRGGSR